MAIKINGVAALAKELRKDLDRSLEPAYLAVAELVRGEIAPYPPAPPYTPPSWYERGYGTRYQDRNGRKTGRKTSEMMGRRWEVRSRGDGAALVQNFASYAPWVHSYAKQAKVHTRRGWVTDRAAVQRVERGGAMRKVIEARLQKLLNSKR